MTSNDHGNKTSNHEPNQLSGGWLALVAAALVVIVVVLSAGLYWFDQWITPTSSGSAVGAATSVAKRANADQPPAGFRHWSDPRHGLIELRRREDERLTRYEWIDEQAGRVRIPIDRAMALIIEDAAKRVITDASASGSSDE